MISALGFIFTNQGMPWEENHQILFHTEIGLALLILSTASRQKQAVSSHPSVPGTACLQGAAGSTHMGMAGMILGRAVWMSS